MTASREQLIEAMGRVIASKGYGAATVAEVVAEAGASPRSFEMHFGNGRECFAAVHEAIVDRALEAARRNCEARQPWPARAVGGLETVVGMCVAEPRLARAATVEIALAGAEGRRAHLDSLARFAALIEAEPEPAERLPARAPLMAVSGVAGLIGEQLARGDAAGLSGQLPELSFALLVPLLGPIAAGEQMDRVAVGTSL